MKLEAAMYRHQSLCCICYTDKQEKTHLKKKKNNKKQDEAKTLQM